MSFLDDAWNDVKGAWNGITGQYDPNSVPNLQNDERNQQVDANGKLQSWAFTGNGPSQAQALLDRNRGINMASQLGAAKSMGGDPALANRNAAEGIARGNADATYQAGLIRSQEQNQAMNNYLDELNATRSQDLGYQNALWNIGQGNSSREQDFWMGILQGAGKMAGGMATGGAGGAAGAAGGAGGAGGAAAAAA